MTDVENRKSGSLHEPLDEAAALTALSVHVRLPPRPAPPISALLEKIGPGKTTTGERADRSFWQLFFAGETDWGRLAVATLLFMCGFALPFIKGMLPISMAESPRCEKLVQASLDQFDRLTRGKGPLLNQIKDKGESHL